MMAGSDIPVKLFDMGLSVGYLSEHEAALRIEQSIKHEVIENDDLNIAGTYYTLADGRIIRAFIGPSGKEMYSFVKGIPKPTVEEIGRTYTDNGESTFESRHRVLGGKNPPKLDGLAPYAIVGYAMVEDYITYMDVDPNETTRETLEKSLSILPGAKFKKVKNSMDAIDHVNTATNLVQDSQKVKKMTDIEQNELKKHIEKLGKGTDIVKVPQKVNDVLDEIIKKNGTPPKGYKGGKPFENSGKNGGQVLPKNTTYKEYDVNPKVKGQDRGAERLVIGENGSAWYTNDHYKTFIKIK